VIGPARVRPRSASDARGLRRLAEDASVTGRHGDGSSRTSARRRRAGARASTTARERLGFAFVAAAVLVLSADMGRAAEPTAEDCLALPRRRPPDRRRSSRQGVREARVRRRRAPRSRLHDLPCRRDRPAARAAEAGLARAVHDLPRGRRRGLRAQRARDRRARGGGPLRRLPRRSARRPVARGCRGDDVPAEDRPISGTKGVFAFVATSRPPFRERRRSERSHAPSRGRGSSPIVTTGGSRRSTSRHGIAV
jgi:hypothetical protein